MGKINHSTYGISYRQINILKGKQGLDNLRSNYFYFIKVLSFNIEFDDLNEIFNNLYMSINISSLKIPLICNYFVTITETRRCSIF